MNGEPEQHISLGKRSHHWSLKVKIGRVLWNVIWALFGYYGTWYCAPWRRFLLRLFGAKIGSGVLICNRVKVLMPWNLDVARGAVIGNGVDIYNFAMVTIGPRTVISQDCYLCTGSHDHTHPNYPLTWEPITLGAECWLTARVLVSPGISIGDGSVVAMGSVIVKDVPPWQIAGGNPAKILKDRIIIDPETGQAIMPGAADRPLAQDLSDTADGGVAPADPSA